MNGERQIQNSPIILTTANARYSHSSLGLRYIMANLGELKKSATLVEHTIKDTPESVVENWLSYNPQIIGIGVYIWNIELLSQAITIIKKSHPKIVIVLGGPEVSYEIDKNLYAQIDFLVQLEGEDLFKKICINILKGNYPKQKTFKSQIIDTKKLVMPYDLYSDNDIKNRKIYVEASRGCAFKCHFCLSSLDVGIRHFDVDLFLMEIKKLYERGARQFKFVDRTFNIDIKLSIKVLTFFLNQFENQDFFLHFEVIPDRLPQELKKYIAQFKEGRLQFEVGIQTFDKEVSERIGRKQNKLKAIENLSYLRTNTNAHLHVDLIIGLPGATSNIFKKDLNELIAIGLQEVQIGMLKNLKGTPLKQHINLFQLNFEKAPPYEIQSNIDINIDQMKQLRNFQKFWDKFYNSGNFIRTMNYLFSLSNPFDEFFKLSNYTMDRFQRTFSISLDELSETLYLYLVEEKNIVKEFARDYILKDILSKEGRKVPNFLKGYKLDTPSIEKYKANSSLKRQRNHLKLD